MIVRTSRAAARSTFRAGFTLMELLVVVALLVVLAGTGGVIYMNYLESAKEDVARAQVQTLTQAAQMYAIAHGGTFAPDLNSLTQPTAAALHWFRCCCVSSSTVAMRHTLSHRARVVHRV